jgi:lysophospholipase L1-like esterase
MKRLTLALLTLTIMGSIQTAQASQQETAARVTYVAFGDGLSLGSPSYVDLLARHLPKGAGYRNLASPYGTLADVISSELPTALAAHPKLVTIWLGGGNDGRVGTPPATYRRELRRLLAALQGAHATVFIGTVPNSLAMPFFISKGAEFAKGAAAHARAFNAAIRNEAATNGATVIDIYRVTKSIWGNPTFVVPDGLHLTSAGEAAIARIFYRVMHHKGVL